MKTTVCNEVNQTQRLALNASPRQPKVEFPRLPSGQVGPDEQLKNRDESQRRRSEILLRGPIFPLGHFTSRRSHDRLSDKHLVSEISGFSSYSIESAFLRPSQSLQIELTSCGVASKINNEECESRGLALPMNLAHNCRLIFVRHSSLLLLLADSTCARRCLSSRSRQK